jgi:hypothetical protein
MIQAWQLHLEYVAHAHTFFMDNMDPNLNNEESLACFSYLQSTSKSTPDLVSDGSRGPIRARAKSAKTVFDLRRTDHQPRPHLSVYASTSKNTASILPYATSANDREWYGPSKSMDSPYGSATALPAMRHQSPSKLNNAPEKGIQHKVSLSTCYLSYTE